jgi:hypothetical protein
MEMLNFWDSPKTLSGSLFEFMDSKCQVIQTLEITWVRFDHPFTDGRETLLETQPSTQHAKIIYKWNPDAGNDD